MQSALRKAGTDELTERALMRLARVWLAPAPDRKYQGIKVMKE